MMQIMPETPTQFHLVICGDDADVLDAETIVVTAPDRNGRGRMPA